MKEVKMGLHSKKSSMALSKDCSDGDVHGATFLKRWSSREKWPVRNWMLTSFVGLLESWLI
jgi:hypothetical protein